VDIVRTLKDINVNVASAEIDTIGAMAKDELFITYEGEPLDGPMVQLVTDALKVRLLHTCLVRHSSPCAGHKTGAAASKEEVVGDLAHSWIWCN
jgi:hypothetical protein